MQGLNLQTQDIGKEIIHYDQVDSTNTVAKARAKEGKKEGCLVIAQQQTAGKGRLGRTWESPKGEGIWMSLILRPHINLEALPQMTLLAGYAMCEAIREVTQEPIKIKWPNDLVLNEKKICGILCESQLSGTMIESVIVGIGVNVNTTKFPKELPHASSLLKETGIAYSREAIISRFCEVFEEIYFEYKQYEDLSFMIEQYKSYCINMNRRVNINSKQQNFECEVIDITSKGALVVQKDCGTIENIAVGEVSVRGLYGYV